MLMDDNTAIDVCMPLHFIARVIKTLSSADVHRQLALEAWPEGLQEPIVNAKARWSCAAKNKYAMAVIVSLSLIGPHWSSGCPKQAMTTKDKPFLAAHAQFAVYVGTFCMGSEGRPSRRLLWRCLTSSSMLLESTAEALGGLATRPQT